MTGYAIVELKGKQYKVSPGDKVDIDLMAAKPEETVIFDKVLLVKNNGASSIGRPYLEKAQVTAKVLEHGKADKIVVFKYKRKTGYRRTRGHRERYTRILIEDIKV